MDVRLLDSLTDTFFLFWMDNSEREWRAYGTQIRWIKADAKKNNQEVLLTTNRIEDAILKNNVIFSEKWEATHDCIDCQLEELHLLQAHVIDLESLSGLQQTSLQHCQDTIAGLEETVAQLVASVRKLEETVCQCHDQLLLFGPHYAPGEEEEMVMETEEEEGEDEEGGRMRRTVLSMQPILLLGTPT